MDTTLAPHILPDPPPRAREADSIARILDGADRVFLRDGLAGASVDDIARAAGVSKATLYRHFDDKTALFIAWLLRSAGRAVAGKFDDPHPEDARPLRDVLRDIALQFLGLHSGQCERDLFRTAVAEAARIPEVGIAFHKSIVAVGQDHIAAVLQRAADRGEIVLGDPRIAACQFMALCRAENFLDSILLPHFRLEAAEMTRQATVAVDFFLAGVRACKG